jgi:hypothetical protein
MTRLGVNVTQVCSLLKKTTSLTKISLPDKTFEIYNVNSTFSVRIELFNYFWMCSKLKKSVSRVCVCVCVFLRLDRAK